MLIRTGECTRCGECCRTVHITVVRDVTLRQHGNLEELKRYLEYRGIRVVGEDAEANALFYAIDVPCSQLTLDNRCRVHNTPGQPLLCHRYPTGPDDIEECGYRFEPEKFAGLPGLGNGK
ncbi:MAG: hypothetical protein COV67_14410 [Nitrospinae bacterium CG11_big_fil_rev_8_21_14_0_20_56_8]|nr:MAG: hypothetical protein COV67_14410 [Nitrospinae bacterium CG11_big_fil_rev_8_21_14_0_20_56_8]